MKTHRVYAINAVDESREMPFMEKQHQTMSFLKVKINAKSVVKSEVSCRVPEYIGLRWASKWSKGDFQQVKVAYS